MDRLSSGEKLAGGSAALLLLLSFFPLWAKIEFSGAASGFDDRFGGWSAASPFYAKLAFVLALVALALIAMRAAAVDVQLPFPHGLSLVALGGLATLLLLLTLLTGPVGDQGSGVGFEYSRGLAMLIGWLVAAGIAAGGYLHMSEEGAPQTGTPLGGGPPAGPPTTGGPGPATSPSAPGTTAGTPGATPTMPTPPGTGPATPPPAASTAPDDDPNRGGTP